MTLSLPSDPVLDFVSGKITQEEMIMELIKDDRESKAKHDMGKSINYFNCKHDVLEKDFNTYVIDNVKYIDSNKANEHMINPMHRKLVNQKVGYIAGKPVAFSTDNEELQKLIDDTIDEDILADIITDYVQGGSVKGYEILYPYVDDEGNFAYVILPAEGTIIIKDTRFQKNIIQTIRYYPMQLIENGTEIELLRVEFYDDEKITFYQQTKDEGLKLIIPGTLNIPINPLYYWYNWTGDLTLQEAIESGDTIVNVGGWETGIPIVQVKNNTEQTTDLKPIKPFIDALDIVTSGFINDLADVQLVIWIIRGFSGQDLSEFMRNLLNFKAILLEGDKDEAEVDTRTVEIPIVARESLMKYCEKQIYKIGEGASLQELSSLGNVTNVAIKVHFSDLDLKANRMIRKLKPALTYFAQFLIEYINRVYGKSFDSKDVNVVITKSMIFNDKEVVEVLVATPSTIMSDKTKMELHPLIDDPDAEQLRIDEQIANNPIPEIDFEEDLNDEDDE